MNPQYLPVPAPTTATALSGAIGVGLLLVISIMLGYLGKRSWKTFDEYLVGHRDIGPSSRAAPLQPPTFPAGLSVEAQGWSIPWVSPGCGLPGSGVFSV